MKKQVHLFIAGSVQGVGYRQFVKSLAKKHQVMGWVRNLSDGRVEIVMQGNDDKIGQLLPLLKEGSFLAEVKEVEMSWEEFNEEYDDFSIR